MAKYSAEEGLATGWFIGVIVVLALLAISYIIFGASDESHAVPVATVPAPTN